VTADPVPDVRVGPPTRHRRAFALAAAVVLSLDQLAKHWALSALDDGPIDLIGSLRLKLAFNDGAAFSLGGGRTTAIAVMAILVSAVIVRMGLRAERRLWAIGLGVVLGGALGNVSDRVFRAGDGFLGGHVVDFIDVQWWPVFNVADMSLWVGIGLLFLASFREPATDAGSA
jgi:signal peptidase II